MADLFPDYTSTHKSSNINLMLVTDDSVIKVGSCHFTILSGYSRHLLDPVTGPKNLEFLEEKY